MASIIREVLDGHVPDGVLGSQERTGRPMLAASLVGIATSTAPLTRCPERRPGCARLKIQGSMAAAKPVVAGLLAVPEPIADGMQGGQEARTAWPMFATWLAGTAVRVRVQRKRGVLLAEDPGVDGCH
jgi:hypothetical protein